MKINIYVIHWSGQSIRYTCRPVHKRNIPAMSKPDLKIATWQTLTLEKRTIGLSENSRSIFKTKYYFAQFCTFSQILSLRLFFHVGGLASKYTICNFPCSYLHCGKKCEGMKENVESRRKDWKFWYKMCPLGFNFNGADPSLKLAGITWLWLWRWRWWYYMVMMMTMTMMVLHGYDDDDDDDGITWLWWWRWW